MINFIDNITDFVVKAFFEIHRIFIITMILLVPFFGDFEINNIFYCSFIIILLSYLLSNIILKKSNRDSKLDILLIILGIIINAMIVIYLFDNFSIDLKLCIFIYFLLIWIQGIQMVTNSYNIEKYFSKFMISLLIMIFFFPILVGKINWEKTNFQNYLYSYFYISLILIARVNISSAYSGNRKKTVNKKKNTRKFNVITTFLIVTISLFSFNSKVFFKQILNYISKFLNYLIYLFTTLILNITDFLAKIFIKNPPNFKNKENKFGGDIFIGDSNITDFNYSFVNFVDNILKKLKWIILFLVTIFSIYYIYKMIKKKYRNKIDEEYEIKDFVLTKKDILNNFKKPFNKLSKNISKLFNKDKSLHIIRQIYIDIINILNKKGYEFEKSFTPNEYIKTIQENAYKVKLISLTKYYNIIRYSNKKITEGEIANALKIKNEIKKINRS